MGLSPALAAVDYTQYQQWPVVNYGGMPYYQVPGMAGVYYDPRRNVYTSQQKIEQSIQADQILQDSADLKAQELNQALHPPGFFSQAAPVLGVAGAAGLAYPVGASLAKGEMPFGLGGSQAATTTAAQGAAQAQQGLGISAALPTAPATTVPAVVTPSNSLGTATAQGLAKPEIISGTKVPLPPNATQGPNGEVLTADGTALDPSTGEVVGKVAQGALGVYLVYKGAKDFKDDKIGGLTSAAYGTTLTGSALGSETLGAAMPYAGLAYGGYNMGKMLLDDNAKYKGATGSNMVRGAGSGAALGASVGSLFPGVGTLVGLGLGAAGGAAIGAIEGLTGSGKGGGQLIRDKWRKSMQEIGFMDQDFRGTAADGSVIDWNKVNGDQGSGVKNMHFEDPVVGAAVAYGDMLASAMGATGTARENIAGELAKGALYNANGDRAVVEQNMRHFAQQLGLDYQTVNANIDALAEKAKGEKDKTTLATNKAAAGMLFSPQPTPSVQPQPQAAPQPALVDPKRVQSNLDLKRRPGFSVR